MTKITDAMQKALNNHNYDFAADYKKLDMTTEDNSYDIIFNIKNNRFELINQKYPNESTGFVRLVGNLIYNPVENVFWAVLTDCQFTATDDKQVTMLLEMLVTKYTTSVKALNQKLTIDNDSISKADFDKQRENEILNLCIQKLGQDVLHLEVHFDDIEDPRLVIIALLSMLHLTVEDEDSYAEEDFKYMLDVSEAIDFITMMVTTRTDKFSKKFLIDLSNLVDSEFELDDLDADDKQVLSYPAVKKLQGALHSVI